MDRWIVPERIAVLRRGKKRILFNPAAVNPLYFPRGGEEALALLNSLRRRGPVAGPPAGLCEPPLFDFLRGHALIVPETGAPELHPRSDARTQPRPSTSLYLLLCQSCNQSCIYCYNGRETYKRDRGIRMPRELAFRAVRQTLARLPAGGRLDLVFFGGEPLLNWPLAREIFRFGDEELKPAESGKEISYHLTSNLTILPDDLIPLARRHKMTFLVDVDGPPEIHNLTRPFRDGAPSFAVTAGNLRKLVDAGFPVSLRATVTSHNVERMVEVAQVHKDLGGAGCAFVGLNPVDSDGALLPLALCPSPKLFARGLRKVYRSGIWPVEDLFPYNEYLAHMQPGYRNSCGCGAPYGNTPVVGADGKMYSCIYLVGDPRYEIGDLAAEDYPRAEPLARMRQALDVDQRERCRGCDVRYLCGGGCPVGVLSVGGNPNASPELKRYAEEEACAVSRTVIEDLLWAAAATPEVRDLAAARPKPVCV